jgi:hypothetical protein
MWGADIDGTAIYMLIYNIKLVYGTVKPFQK